MHGLPSVETHLAFVALLFSFGAAHACTIGSIADTPDKTAALNNKSSLRHVMSKVMMQITIGLLKKAMLKSGSSSFLIDGFPRALDQAQSFEEQIQPCDMVWPQSFTSHCPPSTARISGFVCLVTMSCETCVLSGSGNNSHALMGVHGVRQQCTAWRMSWQCLMKCNQTSCAFVLGAVGTLL